jgi:hypothetical protein
MEVIDYTKDSTWMMAGYLGPTGDDNIRRIKFEKGTGNMQLFGVEFNFNLTAPTEKQESIYTFSWNGESKLWEFIK